MAVPNWACKIVLSHSLHTSLSLSFFLTSVSLTCCRTTSFLYRHPPADTHPLFYVIMSHTSSHLIKYFSLYFVYLHSQQPFSVLVMHILASFFLMFLFLFLATFQASNYDGSSSKKEQWHRIKVLKTPKNKVNEC